MKLADSVLHRIVQIVQEGMLMGVDVADIMRQVELRPDASDPHVLVLTEEYKEMVQKQHESLLKFVEEKKNESSDDVLIKTPFS